MSEPLYVTKSDGSRKPLDLDKIHRVISWAAERLSNVSIGNTAFSTIDEDLFQLGQTDIFTFIRNIQRLVLQRLRLSDRKSLLVLSVLLPLIVGNLRELCQIPCTRQQGNWLSLDIRELLRITSKFSRAPPDASFLLFLAN